MFDQLDSLIKIFHTSRDDIGDFTPVDAEELPQQYASLLAHNDHMTVTVEAWHNSLVDVHVLEAKQDDDSYSRRIVLNRQRDGTPVQFGIMRIKLGGLPEIVRMEIESRALPLGRIMIRHHLLREVELCQLWRVQPGAELVTHLQCNPEVPIFGRTARILTEGEVLVELLEIVLS